MGKLVVLARSSSSYFFLTKFRCMGSYFLFQGRAVKAQVEASAYHTHRLPFFEIIERSVFKIQNRFSEKYVQVPN